MDKRRARLVVVGGPHLGEHVLPPLPGVMRWALALRDWRRDRLKVRSERHQRWLVEGPREPFLWPAGRDSWGQLLVAAVFLGLLLVGVFTLALS